MDILFSILLFFHVLVCFLLVLVDLMQRPKQEGLGAAFASGMMNESFGAQTTDILQKGTRNLAIAFFALTITLAVIKAQGTRSAREASAGSLGSEVGETGSAVQATEGRFADLPLPGETQPTVIEIPEESVPVLPEVPGLEALEFKTEAPVDKPAEDQAQPQGTTEQPEDPGKPIETAKP